MTATWYTQQIGIDENGLGSQLGPMTVTGVRLALDGAAGTAAEAFAAARDAGIGDSKALCAHGAMGAVEGRVLALLAEHLDLRPRTLAVLSAALGLEDEATLRALCPEGEAPTICFADSLPLPAFGAGPSEDDLRAAALLRTRGVRLMAARVSVVCARGINRGREAGRSRFDLDLAAMVRLARALHDGGGREIVALCGKVGGRKSYAEALEPLGPLVSVLGEAPALSSYRVPGFGEIRFVRDGDASEPAISFASLLGKYARELWMHRHNRYWTRAVPDAQPASGYHDPVTARLVAATRLVRRERAVPDDCFQR